MITAFKVLYSLDDFISVMAAETSVLTGLLDGAKMTIELKLKEIYMERNVLS